MPRPNVSKKTIAVDIDEVLFPMVDDLISYLDKNHKVKLSEADFAEYYFEKVWFEGPKEAYRIFSLYKGQLSIEIAPVKGAQVALRQLAKSYDIVVVSSRDSSFEVKTRKWLNNHFPDIFKGIHLLGKDHGIHSVQLLDKAEVCTQLGVFCLIDDSIKHIQDATKLGMTGLLFGDYSWNQVAKLPKGVLRVKNWQEVLEYFNAQN